MTRRDLSVRLPRLRTTAVVLVGLVAVCWAVGLWAGAPDRDAPEKRDRPQTEREVALQQLEVMRLALPALREADRKEAVVLLERGIRVREINLEGRRDEEAKVLRQRAPNRQQLAEILAAAARQWREFGKPDKAEAVGRLARTFAAGRDRPPSADRPQRDRPRREGDQQDRSRREGDQQDRPRRDGDERAAAMRQLQLMRIALPALREADKKDAIELLERAIRAREVSLERRTDREANVIRQRAPDRRQLAEVLGAAAQLWRKFKNQEKAVALTQLARQLAAPRDADRPTDRRAPTRSVGRRKTDRPADRPPRDADRPADRVRRESDGPQRTDRDPRRDAPMDRIERLERRLAELAKVVEKLQAELGEMKRKRD